MNRLRKRLNLCRVEAWWWLERHGLPLLAYSRRKQAEYDHLVRFGENIYGEPMWMRGITR